MTDLLAIRLSSTHDDVQWVRVDETGATRGSLATGSLADAVRHAEDRDVLVVLDDVAVTRTHCDLPVSGKKLAQALPYALEDQFAGDVDALHFGAGAADDNGIRPVAALDESAVATVLERLADAGIQAQHLHTWHDAIGPLEGFVQLLAIGEQVLVCDAEGDVAALRGLPPDAVLDAWRAARDEDAEEVNVRIYYDAEAKSQFGAALDALSNSGADLKQLADGVLPFAGRHILSRGGINLLQGDYALRSNVGASLRPWVLAATLAGIALVLSVVGNAVEMRELERTSARLDGDIEQLLRRVQPGTGAVSNPERQLSNLVSRARGATNSAGTSTGDPGGAPFLPTLNTVAGALAAAGDNTRIDAIAYRGGVFDLRVSAPSAQALDGFTQHVTDVAGLTAQIQRTEQDEEVIKSFVKISGGGE
ncbi:MAG: type II secretion system protein GspL [Pseudomonadota bacterium]